MLTVSQIKLRQAQDEEVDHQRISRERSGLLSDIATLQEQLQRSQHRVSELEFQVEQLRNQLR